MRDSYLGRQLSHLFSIKLLNKLDDCPLFDQEYSFQITMRQQWNDKRLAYKERLQGQLAGNYNHSHDYYYHHYDH